MVFSCPSQCSQYKYCEKTGRFEMNLVGFGQRDKCFFLPGLQSEGIRECMEQLRSEFRGQVTGVCAQLQEVKQTLLAVMKQ